MSHKNHALDDPIAASAFHEFLEKGYAKASMRKIAADAGVTIGAIYTRYPTKDSLFCSLVQPFIDRISAVFGELRTEYFSAVTTPEELARLSCRESEGILHLLFDDYDRALLLLCRSVGSSVEGFFDQVVQQKITETERYCQSSSQLNLDSRLLKLLISSQFHMYFQIMNEGYPLDVAREITRAAMIYHLGGWHALLDSPQNQEAHHEI